MHPIQSSPTSKTTMEIWFVLNLPRVLLKFISETFKVAPLKYTNPSIRKTIKEMQSLIELPKVLIKFVSTTFSEG